MFSRESGLTIRVIPEYGFHQKHRCEIMRGRSKEIGNSADEDWYKKGVKHQVLFLNVMATNVEAFHK